MINLNFKLGGRSSTRESPIKSHYYKVNLIRKSLVPVAFMQWFLNQLLLNVAQTIYKTCDLKIGEKFMIDWLR